MTMKDKIAVVTGAASGIGRATAQALAEAGATVIVADIDPDKGEASAAAIRRNDHKAEFMSVDMTDAASIGAFAAALQAKFGPVDILVNGAGWGRTAPFWKARPSSGASWSRSTWSAR